MSSSVFPPIFGTASQHPVYFNADGLAADDMLDIVDFVSMVTGVDYTFSDLLVAGFDFLPEVRPAVESMALMVQSDYFAHGALETASRDGVAMIAKALGQSFDF